MIEKIEHFCTWIETPREWDTFFRLAEFFTPVIIWQNIDEVLIWRPDDHMNF